MWTKQDMAEAEAFRKKAAHEPVYAIAYALMRGAEALDDIARELDQLGWSSGHGHPGAAQFVAQALTSNGKAKP